MYNPIMLTILILTSPKVFTMFVAPLFLVILAAKKLEHTGV